MKERGCSAQKNCRGQSERFHRLSDFDFPRSSCSRTFSFPDTFHLSLRLPEKEYPYSSGISVPICCIFHPPPRTNRQSGDSNHHNKYGLLHGFCTICYRIYTRKQGLTSIHTRIARWICIHLIRPLYYYPSPPLNTHISTQCHPRAGRANRLVDLLGWRL